MVRQLDCLSDLQRVQLPLHAQRWIEKSLRTAPAPREVCERTARRAYEDAGLPWHGRVAWLDSPLALTLAGTIAALLIERRGRGVLQRALPAVVERVVMAVTGPPSAAIAAQVCAVARTVTAGVHSLRRPAVRATDATTRIALQAALSAPLTRGVSTVVNPEVHALVGKWLSDELFMSVGGLVCNAVRDAVAGGCRRTRAGLGVQGAARAVLRALSGRDSLGAWQLLPDSAHPAPVVSSYYREVCQLSLPGDHWARAKVHEELAQSTGGWWYPHRDFVLLCERAQALHREHAPPDGGGRMGMQLHRGDGPAVSFRDGFCLHVSHGRRVPAWILESPGRITVESIQQERNREVRSVMLEQYGRARYLADAGAHVVERVPAITPSIPWPAAAGPTGPRR